VAKVICDQKGEGDSRERFLEFWRSESEQHFRIEEEIMLPGSGLPGPDQDEEVARMLSEHLAIRRGAARLVDGESDPAGIVELAELLRAHVRFEERELFPRIERELDPESLSRLASKLEAFDC
jgi:hemerythrin-like domain-containing protein